MKMNWEVKAYQIYETGFAKHIFLKRKKESEEEYFLCWIHHVSSKDRTLIDNFRLIDGRIEPIRIENLLCEKQHDSLERAELVEHIKNILKNASGIEIAPEILLTHSDPRMRNLMRMLLIDQEISFEETNGILVWERSTNLLI